MSRAGRARRIATAAAFGGGSIGLAGAAFAGVLVGEVKLARRWVGAPEHAKAPDGSTIWGQRTGTPIVFAMLGDSSAAGLGVGKPIETPGVLIAAGLSELAERPVRLLNVAVVGATSAELEPQCSQVLPERPDVALIMIGANDVTHRMRPAESVRHLAETVRRLRAADIEVVVATCPDLGSVKPIAPPLRWIARAWSRNLAAAQTIATVEAGGRTVALADILGPEFAARPREMFSADRFHPSAEGYAAAAAVLLPTISVALGVWPEENDRPPRPLFGEGVRPVSRAAARAAARPGAEVAGAQVDGHESGPRGRWAQLRRRSQPPVPHPAAGDTTPIDATPSETQIQQAGEPR
jgi:lysophospholipase L1-like esterase